MTVIETIQNVINNQLDRGSNKFIVYPYGIAGYAVRRVLMEYFNIEPLCVIDNNKAGTYEFIKGKEYLYDLQAADITILVASKNPKVVDAIKFELKPISYKFNIVDVFPLNVGKHTIGNSILAHNTGYMIEKIGAYCSFADGCSVVGNHDLNGVSTCSLFQGFDLENLTVFRDIIKNISISRMINLERCVIGNDVWLGKNVIICNGAKIGDGAVVAAGAVVTKDVPSFAIVGGISAHILKFRYRENQIDKLNKIKWWEWSDEKVAECFEDFSNIELFLSKHS